MADRSYLEWPFLDDGHRDLAARIDDWAEAEIAPLAGDEPQDDASLDACARELVRRLAGGGWLRYCAPGPYGGRAPELDVRALCLLRETLARHSGLADFCFAMQGLGGGAIAWSRSATARPGASASTTKADSPFAPGASPVRAKTTY